MVATVRWTAGHRRGRPSLHSRGPVVPGARSPGAPTRPPGRGPPWAREMRWLLPDTRCSELTPALYRLAGGPVPGLPAAPVSDNESAPHRASAGDLDGS